MKINSDIKLLFFLEREKERELISFIRKDKIIESTHGALRFGRHTCLLLATAMGFSFLWDVSVFLLVTLAMLIDRLMLMSGTFHWPFLQVALVLHLSVLFLVDLCIEHALCHMLVETY